MSIRPFVMIGGLLSLLAIGATIAWVRFELLRDGPAAHSSIIDVGAGDTISKISRDLFETNVVRESFLMRLEARRRRMDKSLHVGEFLIPSKASITDVLDILEEGKVIQHPITIPEGLTTRQILMSIRKADFLTGNINEVEIAEGTLLPSTYFFPRGTSRSAVIKRMKNAQEYLLNEIWPTRDDDLPISTKDEAIILASIVEKESSSLEEMPIVAGVFTERLRRGMRLESDPTTIYGISRGEPLYNANGERRTLYRSELRAKTDWNTYQMEGLPKTPICNPGKNAIAAVLQPDATDYLFFVADGKGGHSFARTLDEHLANVARYREYERAEIERERSVKSR